LLIIALATGLLLTGNAYSQEVEVPKDEDELG
jgi:hypothetical protein